MTWAARHGLDDRLAVDVFLPDGSHVIVAWSDELTEDADLDDELVEILLEAGDGEDDLLRHLQACAAARGLAFRASLDRDPTTVLLSAIDRSPDDAGIVDELSEMTGRLARDAARSAGETETRRW